MILESIFDDTGTVYNGDLIVTFKHAVYRVNPLGNYSVILESQTAIQNYEGLAVIPNLPRYGKLAGCILIPQTEDPTPIDPVNTISGSSRSGISIAAIGLDKSVTIIQAPCHADSVFVVAENDQFYALNADYGRVHFTTWEI
jgi:hypothetical protein